MNGNTYVFFNIIFFYVCETKLAKPFAFLHICTEIRWDPDYFGFGFFFMIPSEKII